MFLQELQGKVKKWRTGQNGIYSGSNNAYCGHPKAFCSATTEEYHGVLPETKNILRYIKNIGYLHEPQFEALETYIYLKEIQNNEPLAEVLKRLYPEQKKLLTDGLGIEEARAFYYVGEQNKIDEVIKNKFPTGDYTSQVYALTMGAGKTLLMGVMMIYDFILSYRYPEDKRFAKNVLIFAPDKTIIESLKEIKYFDYLRIFPREYSEILLNLKYHYLEDTRTKLTATGNYNVIVSNSQKIILKTTKGNKEKRDLFNDVNSLEKREIERENLRVIRNLEHIAIFVDEAHHTFGTNLEGELKKVKQTIDYIHTEGKTELIGMISFIGTPYVERKIIDDVVYYFGLKEGIEKGILKQVNILNYGNVKTQSFIDSALDIFFDQYNQSLDGKLPKIAFYAPSIEDLRQELKPMIEKSLLKNRRDLNMILEYHTEAEKNKSEFLKLDTNESAKQIILLVGKGTEGWNCKSLVATALFRKPKSPVFVLQSTTRCLRAIGDNTTKASVFLSDDNYKILDKELSNNFNMGISELNAQEQKTTEHELKVLKKKKLKVKKELKEIIAIKKQAVANIKIDFSKFVNGGDKAAFIQQSSIYFDGQKANYEVGAKQELTTKNIEDDVTFYSLVEKINRYTHLSCLEIKAILENSQLSKNELIKKIKENNNALDFIINQILSNIFSYEEKSTIYEEEIELTKNYPFKINVNSNKNDLVVYKKTEQIGFHIDPYNFDSEDEKNLFLVLSKKLKEEEAITDIYFTGGSTSADKNDFYFEYYNPEHQKIKKYFPDFLIETSCGRYLVVEVKAENESSDYYANKKSYKGNFKELHNEVFSKEVGFNEFKKLNQRFEYQIIFDAQIQERQKELMLKIRGMLN